MWSNSGSEQAELQCGPAHFEPIQSVPGFGFDSSRRDSDELFSCGEVGLAPSLAPDVRDSAQLFDSNTATSGERIQNRSRLGRVLEDIELFHCPVGFSFARVDAADAIQRPLLRLDALAVRLDGRVVTGLDGDLDQRATLIERPAGVERQ